MVADHEILTLKEVCQMLKVHKSTLYRLLREGNIPSFRIGGTWRFRRDDLERWVTNQTVG
jgi:excisionase family DNA binding protein